MTWKCWTPGWQNPGSRKVDPVLDLKVNRNLTVNKDLTVNNNTLINGKLTVKGGLFPPWTAFTPTITGYQSAGDTSTPATGFTYTAVGRYVKLGTTVFFYYYVNCTVEPITFRSNLYIDLPPFPPGFNISAIGNYHKVSDTDPRLIRSITASALYTDTKLMIYPSNWYSWDSGSSTPITINFTTMSTAPWEIWLSGNYESTV